MNHFVAKRIGLTGLPAFLAILCLFLLPGFAFAASLTQIFILHSYSDEYPWTQGQHQGFIKALSQDEHLNAAVSTEFLDTKRRAYDGAYAEELVRHLLVKYKGYKPSAIYVTDDNALLFARDSLSRVFPDTPVFFSGVNDYGVQASVDPSLFTGVFERKEVVPNLEWLLAMDKTANDLVFIGDNSNTYQAIAYEVRDDLIPYGLRAAFIAEKELDKALARLRNLPGKYLFLTTLGGMTDADGKVLPLHDSLKSLVKTGRIVISMEDAYIIEGVLGGHVTSGREQGMAAGRLFLAHHHGKPMADLPPILHSPNAFVFDDQVLHRFGITLPKDIIEQAVLLNPLPGFYERYRSLILGSLILLAALLFMVITGALSILTRKNRELHLAQNRVESTNTLFKELAGQSRTLHWEVNSDGIYTHVSPVSYAVLGYQPGELINQKHFSDLLTKENRNSDKASVVEFFAQKAPFHDLEQSVWSKNGDQIWVLSNGVPIFDDTGRFQGYRGSDSDITERKQAEKERENLEVRNRHLQKTESLTRMAGAIAHHFNNQLAVVIGHLDLLQIKQAHDKPAESLTEAMKAAQKAAQMSSLMLTYLGQTTAEKKWMDMSEVCQKALPLIQAMLLKTIRLDTDFPSPGPKINGNAEQIQQVLTNIVTNAWESCSAGGCVYIRIKTLSMADIPTSHRYPLGWQPQDIPYACLEVSDTGCGITGKDIEKLFDPFFTSKFTGRGLGLPVVLGIVRAHHGVITLESKPGLGSTFRIFLPTAAT